ncbi:acyl transferase/acyl hydrolase/lysophospholipase [Schizophyllum commune]
MTLPQPGVRLLAFDDGGSRGLAMLLQLRNVMREFQQDACLRTLPLPCERFDIIAGSGTGGLIALLLGRLRFSIDRAIECYVRVVEHALMEIKSGGIYKASSLEKVLKEICGRYGEGEETSLLEQDPILCKTFVCTREVRAAGNPVLRKLRTYPHPSEPGLTLTVHEAVRATMGNATFFKPLEVQQGGSYAKFLDAGDDHYNPVFDLYQEAQILYPARDVAYLLSLGPGDAATVGENPPRRFVSQMRLPPAHLSMLRHLADRCDCIAVAFQSEYGTFDDKYCRLSPSLPVYDRRVLPDKVDALEELVSPYCTNVADKRAVRHDTAR